MSIRLLPPQLANQIAAGEVVERPASVVKELVENSLDAGATEIFIEIEKGGSKLIRIRDNGCGVAKEELTLALSRHATSKIHDFADLAAIASLGFRGEALASISSVARLTLTSKPADQDTAWQAQAEGREMAVQLRPAAHPVGSTVEVLDLFFNTPARRRFLKSDKTEFSHIEELIKRLALSRFDVSWTLVHNAQLVRQLKAASDASAQQKRLALLCGKTFASQALYIQSSYEQMTLHGWILPPACCTSQLLCQYSYVNGRMMRDKLLGHAIRQAYADLLTVEAQPAYVLYLTLPADDVDVNVHPAKHEVRFHQSRLVHDFVATALTDALQQAESAVLPVEFGLGTPPVEAKEQQRPSEQLAAAPLAPAPTPVMNDRPANLAWGVSQAALSHVRNSAPSRIGAPQWRAETPRLGQVASAAPDWQLRQTAPPGWPVSATDSVTKPESQQNSAERPAAVHTHANLQPEQQTGFWQLGNGLLLAQHDGACWLLDGIKSVARFYTTQPPLSQALLLPIRLPLQAEELALLTQSADGLAGMGFDFLLNNQTLIVRAVPQLLAGQPLTELLPGWWRLVLQQMPWWDALLLLLWQRQPDLPALTQVLVELRQLPQLWHAVPLDLSASLQLLQQLPGEPLNAN